MTMAYAKHRDQNLNTLVHTYKKRKNVILKFNALFYKI